MQCNKHVVKMVLESAQLLSTAHRVLDGKLEVRKSATGRREKVYVLANDPQAESAMYRASHINHPCAIWVRESIANYMWLSDHFEALCDEYHYRYGRTHATDTKLRSVLDDAPAEIPDIGLTPFVLAMKSNPECIHPEDPVRSYHEYYRTKENRFSMIWTRRPIPEWFYHA